MNVSLTPELESMVREKVESGLYTSASEVVREALRLMAENDRATRFRQSLEEAKAQYDRGEFTRLTPGLIDDIAERAMENARNGKPVSDDVKLGKEQLERLRSSLKQADEQIARGEFYEDSDEFWELVERGADEADRRGDPIDPDVCP
jgi:antitoxin ParD1/3/4